MLWLYLHFPHLLLDHLRRAHEAPGAMVVVSGTQQRVAQACPQAQQQGVQVGMRLKTALTLVPELAIHQADENRESAVLAQQARWLYRHAAQIALHPPDGLLLEASSLQRLYGGLPALWRTLQQALAERRLTAWLATGLTPQASRLVARQGPGECEQAPGRLKARVAALPLEAAGFEPRTRERLARLGLTRLGELFQLPPQELARRLAPETLAHVQQIQGVRPDPQAFWQPPPHFHQQVDFVREVEQAQGLLFPLQPMLAELEADLQWRQQDTDSLHLTLTHRNRDTTRLTVRTSGPEHRASAFAELIRIRLEQHPLTAPVVALALTVSRFLARDAPASADLLGETTNLQEAWHTLVSRLQARLGDAALHHLTPEADHRPERAWSGAPLQRRSPRVADTLAPPLRPLWLLSSPQPLQQTPVAWLSEPERINSGWWDGERVQRDYYIAQLPSGQLAWLFRDVGGGWFIHGWFG
ncbi:MAG: DNA polymerase Y family protein [Marinobacter sp.]|uniref:Y-family DNA polymerase n=1 Tax=Marinobacter sp. TaxID=50741 RepID=UPI00299F165D|nr:DNA polymerase Y family protein [Marinobacter sp.]MDX1757808.1 DNA polymerase Y family protein [Marinobacter sp.]